MKQRSHLRAQCAEHRLTVQSGHSHPLAVRPKPMNFAIRNETAADAPAISAVTTGAFKTLAVSQQTEVFVIEALRAERALTVSLVAEVDDVVVGHVAFSPVRISDGTLNWFVLGPVSVHPALQRQGIGRALVAAGLNRLRGQGARGCCVVGHPAYYPQFGFVRPVGLGAQGVRAEVFFALGFGDAPLPQGSVYFHDAFQATGPTAPAAPRV